MNTTRPTYVAHATPLPPKKARPRPPKLHMAARANRQLHSFTQQAVGNSHTRPIPTSPLPSTTIPHHRAMTHNLPSHAPSIKTTQNPPPATPSLSCTRSAAQRPSPHRGQPRPVVPVVPVRAGCVPVTVPVLCQGARVRSHYAVERRDESRRGGARVAADVPRGGGTGALLGRRAMC